MSKSDFLTKLANKLEKSDSSTLDQRSAELNADDLWVTTGIPELDFNIKTFGIKTGIIEIAGKSRGGKTTIGLTVVGKLQAEYPDAICIFLFSEERISPDYSKRLGVDNERVIVVRNKLVEDLFFEAQIKIDEIDAAWREAKMEGNPKIILLWDSIGATSSRADAEAWQENVKRYKKAQEENKKFDFKHAKMAAFAKVARDCAKALIGQLYDKDMILICINHLTDNLNDPHGGKTSSGGSWREYFCWLRLQVSKKEGIFLDDDGKKVEVAQVSEVKVIKNDFGGYGKTDIEILFGHGLILNDADIAYGVAKGIIKKEGKTGFKFANISWNSPRTFFALYEEQHKMLPILHKKITEARHQDVVDEKE